MTGIGKKQSSRVLTPLGIGMLLIAALVSPVNAADAPDQPTTATAEQSLLEDNLVVRASLGFEADRFYVQSLRGSPADVGTADYGLAMTASERAEFERRMETQVRMDKYLLPVVTKRADYGGVYIDNHAGGRIVILTTSDAPNIDHELRSIDPELADDLVVRKVDFTEAELEEAMNQLFQARRDHFPGVEVYSVSIDFETTSLVVDAPLLSLGQVENGVGSASAALGGIPIRVQSGEPVSEAACTRTNCSNPMYAGIQIRRGSVTGSRCTMGFHIRRSTDEQFVTTGHCSHGTLSNNWYHSGYGFIGSVLASSYVNGVDAMRVQMPDSQASRCIVGEGCGTISIGTPCQGCSIRASLGVTGAVRSGTVAASRTTWTGGGCDCQQTGARAQGISATGGDSGSPVYRGAIGSGSYTAVGLIATTGGYFSRMDDAANSLNFVIY